MIYLFQNSIYLRKIVRIPFQTVHYTINKISCYQTKNKLVTNLKGMVKKRKEFTILSVVSPSLPPHPSTSWGGG